MAKSRFDTGTGPSQRPLRVGELVRRTLSDVLMRGDVHDPELIGVSITVGEVRMSPDLRIATVYVLPLGGVNVHEAIKALARSAYELRRAVNKAVKLKFSPELRFLPDETFDQMDRTRAMLSDERVRKDLDAAGSNDDGI
ncbi:MAG: 30S ribosome-binding factor RbfA [Pseudomonadota bacterium]